MKPFLYLTMGLVTAGVLWMLDTIARDLSMDSIAEPLVAILIGALAAGRFLPSLLASFTANRRLACLWQGRAVLLVAVVTMTGSTFVLLSGPNVTSVPPEQSMRQLVRACLWGLGLVGCWLAVRQAQQATGK